MVLQVRNDLKVASYSLAFVDTIIGDRGRNKQERNLIPVRQFLTFMEIYLFYFLYRTFCATMYYVCLYDYVWSIHKNIQKNMNKRKNITLIIQ